jgi:hypothetical protein
MTTRWTAQNRAGTTFTMLGPIPRVGETVSLPDDAGPRVVEQVLYRASRNFDRATIADVSVTIILGE